MAEQARALDLPAGYVSEINLAAPALVKSLAERLETGLLLFIDYGFGRSEYYHLQRHMGTLRAHYRHHALDDPFYLPGLCDLTAHVDFSAIARAGREAGLEFAGYSSQASFLLNSGLTELLMQTSPTDVAAYLPQANAVQRLVSPAEMGELFKDRVDEGQRGGAGRVCARGSAAFALRHCSLSVRPHSTKKPKLNSVRADREPGERSPTRCWLT